MCEYGQALYFSIFLHGLNFKELHSNFLESIFKHKPNRGDHGRRVLVAIPAKLEYNVENYANSSNTSNTLDMSLNYKQHILNAKMKVATRNYLLTKLSISKWGANPSTMRTTALSLNYFTAEYATPVWARPCQEPGPRTKSSMPVSYSIPKANQR